MQNKGQVSAEFLVILGVVLVIAMIAIGLTVLFSQSSRNVFEGESRAYWSAQPRPLRILEYEAYYYSGAPALGEVALLVENADSKPATLRSFVFEPYGAEVSFNVYSAHSSNGAVNPALLVGTSGPSALTGLNIELAPSERRTLFLRTSTICSTSSNGLANADMYENTLKIYYDTPYFSGLSFEGVRPIRGICNKN